MPTFMVALEVLAMTEGEALGTASCLTCRELLGLHQPDADAADLLLGTCDICKNWFIIDAERGQILRLPRPADLLTPC